MTDFETTFMDAFRSNKELAAWVAAVADADEAYQQAKRRADPSEFSAAVDAHNKVIFSPLMAARALIEEADRG